MKYLIQKLYSKYKNLKQYPFTHFISIGSLLVFIQPILLYVTFIITGDAPKSGAGGILAFYIIYLLFFYLIYLGISLLIGLICYLTKIKIKNNFLISNKIYNIIWNLGNFLFSLFLLGLFIGYLK